MRRLAAVFAAGLVALGLPTAASADGTGASGGSDPVGGAISAGVYHYAGHWRGRGSPCSWEPATGDTALDEVQGVETITKVDGGVRYTLYVVSCPGTGEQLRWIAPGTPRLLATDAWSALRRLVPAPEVRTAPEAAAAFVTVPTWFWTTTAWQPISVTAWVPTPDGGTVWATATATPVELALDPGDGTAPIRCTGPGTAWEPAFGDEATSPCAHTFEHTSLLAPGGTAYHGTLSITWETAWTSSSGEGGPLAPIVTGSPVRFVVGEIQALVTS